MSLPYTEGQIVQFTGTFTDVYGNPIDPSTVTFHYAIKTAGPFSALGPATVLTYEGSSQPGVGLIARTGVGVYVTQVDTTGKPGQWFTYYESTGSAQTTGTDQVTVLPLPF